MDPPITLILTEVEADVFRVTGRARMLGAIRTPAELRHLLHGKAAPLDIYLKGCIETRRG